MRATSLVLILKIAGAVEAAARNSVVPLVEMVNLFDGVAAAPAPEELRGNVAKLISPAESAGLMLPP